MHPIDTFLIDKATFAKGEVAFESFVGVAGLLACGTGS
jgi:hypothetical protein